MALITTWKEFKNFSDCLVEWGNEVIRNSEMYTPRATYGRLAQIIWNYLLIFGHLLPIQFRIPIFIKEYIWPILYQIFLLPFYLNNKYAELGQMFACLLCEFIINLDFYQVATLIMLIGLYRLMKSIKDYRSAKTENL